MEVVLAGVPALGTMLAIAGIALVLGLVALWLARRHSRTEHRAHSGREVGRPTPGDRSGPPPPPPPTAG